MGETAKPSLPFKNYERGEHIMRDFHISAALSISLRRTAALIAAALTLAALLAPVGLAASDTDAKRPAKPGEKTSVSGAIKKKPSAVTDPTESGKIESIYIKGDAYAVNLTELFLGRLELTDEDIVPLSKMTKLTNLSLYNNYITDITPLSGLKNLQTLTLLGNQIKDIAPLSGLTKLSSLILDGNPIKDITPLFGLSNLRSLSLKGCGLVKLQLDELKKALPKCNIIS
jgi:Leucine-rich repeat (LRR) protein